MATSILKSLVKTVVPDSAIVETSAENGSCDTSAKVSLTSSWADITEMDEEDSEKQEKPTIPIDERKQVLYSKAAAKESSPSVSPVMVKQNGVVTKPTTSTSSTTSTLIPVFYVGKEERGLASFSAGSMQFKAQVQEGYTSFDDFAQFFDNAPLCHQHHIFRGRRATNSSIPVFLQDVSSCQFLDKNEDDVAQCYKVHGLPVTLTVKGEKYNVIIVFAKAEFFGTSGASRTIGRNLEKFECYYLLDKYIDLLSRLVQGEVPEEWESAINRVVAFSTRKHYKPSVSDKRARINKAPSRTHKVTTSPAIRILPRPLIAGGVARPLIAGGVARPKTVTPAMSYSAAASARKAPVKETVTIKVKKSAPPKVSKYNKKVSASKADIYAAASALDVVEISKYVLCMVRCYETNSITVTMYNDLEKSTKNIVDLDNKHKLAPYIRKLKDVVLRYDAQCKKLLVTVTHAGFSHSINITHD